MPALNRSALVQAVLLNQRLAAARTDLQAALKASPFDSAGVADTLRDISANAVYGQEVASLVSTWGPGKPVGSDLGDLYDRIHRAASDALIPSVRLETAYRQSAKAMVTLLAGVKAIDDRARALALANDAVIPDASIAP
jgi:hypothetical protein